MTPAPPQRPLPLGELLEQLRLEGFAVTPDVYDRCFRIADVYFPHGLNNESDPVSQLQELRELLGPVVARSDSEQEQFGTIFYQFFSESIQQTGRLETQTVAPSPENPTLKNKLVWGSILALAALLFGLYSYFPIEKKGVNDTGKDPGDSTLSQPTNLNCVLKVSVKSIEGSTVTFQNSSPGLKQGYRYQWNFGDGSMSTLTDSLVSHTFSPLSASIVTTVTLTDGGCNQTVQITNLYQDSQPSLPSFPLIKAPPFLQTTYTINWWYLLLAILIGSRVIGVFLRRYFFPEPKIEPSNGPPFSLTFPDQEKTIKVAESMDVWARQLNQRDEGQRQVMDISRTLRATARMGGYPSIYYQQIKIRPRYLVLIDSRSTFHQQARLYTYLSKVLTDDEVELETYFFNADPRTCWNEKYPKGISLNDLYRLHRSSYLVLITDGIRLIDFPKGTVTSWVNNLFSSWENRALLTPVYPENWTYIEAILARFFIVLPATPDGQLLLRDYFQLGELPTFQELRRRFQVNIDQVPDRGFFGKSAEQLTLTDIDQFLDNPFDTENPTEAEKISLKQWAYATAVYPTPTWEMTLSIGKAIEQHHQPHTLVTTTNLLKITALPWLQQSKIPDQLRQEMLQRFQKFPSELKSRIQQNVLDLLESVKTTPGSLAEEERLLHTYEVMLTDEKQHQAGLRKLAPYQAAGLITDKVIEGKVAAHDRRIRIAYQLSMVILAVFGFVFSYLLLPAKTNKPVAAWSQLLYSQTDSMITDSAAIYNNLAASISVESLENTDTLTRIRAIGQLLGYRYVRPQPNRFPSNYIIPANQPELYGLKLVFLMASLRHRNTFEALYNLHALRFERSSYILGGSPEWSFANSHARKIIAPTSFYSLPGVSPNDSSLVEYVKLLNQNLVADSLVRRLDSLDSYGARMRYGNRYNEQKAGIKTSDSYVQSNVNRTKLELSIAQTAAQFNRINLYLPEAPQPKNVLRLRLPQLALSANRIDSLARIDATWVKLVLEDKSPLTVVPATTIPKTPTKTKARKPVKTKNRPTTPTKNPTKAGPYTTPTKTASDDIPATSTPETKPPTTATPAIDSSKIAVTQYPTTPRGIPGDYGVLIGVVRQSKVVNNTLFLVVTANNVDYQVRIGDENASSSAKSYDSPIIAIAENDAVKKIPAYQKLYSQKPGFYQLAKNNNSGALDYLRTGGSYTDFKVNQGLSLPALTKFMIAFQELNFSHWGFYNFVKEFIFNALGYPKSDFKVNSEMTTAKLLSTLSSQTRIYVWGSRWQPAKPENPFKLRDGFYEMRYVHMNQGFYPPNENVNAPWQDGGFMLESGDLKAIAIRFSSQSVTVDANGDPLKASAK